MRLKVAEASGRTFSHLVRIREKRRLEVFTVSLRDINKALAPKTYTDLKTRLLRQY